MRTTRSRRASVSALLAAGLALAACGGGPRSHLASGPGSPHPSAPSSTAATSTTALPSTTTAPPRPVPACPLTDVPVSGGVVPARPALAIKIGNDAAARPQSGLDHADVVFEEPIEGAITRLLAIYQCQEAPSVGPVRSTRWIDAQLLPQFGHPAFGFAGGIIPDEQLIANSGVADLNFMSYYGYYQRIPGRYPPENLYTSTSSLWSLVSSATPPSPIFTYAAPGGAGQPTASALLGFSGIYSAGWTWNQAEGVWIRSVNGSVDTDASGQPVRATNVVIERVTTYPGPIPEDSLGSLGVRSVTVGSGPAVVLTNGHAITGTWSRQSISQPTQLSGPGGTIALAPGPTWVELLPTSGSLSLQAG